MGASPHSAPLFPYKETDWLDSLPGYDMYPGVSQLLDGLRGIQESGSYYFQAFSVPASGDDANIAAFDSFEGEISIVPESILTMVSSYSTQAEGFKVQVYDKGSKTTLFAGTFGKDESIFGQIRAHPVYGDQYRGPHILAAPFVVVRPGQVNVEIRNMSASANVLQVAFYFAVPVSTRSLGRVQARGGRV